MKTAKLSTWKVASVACPECGQEQDGPSGSLNIESWEWDKVPDVMRCHACGTSFKKPANPWAKRKAKGA